VTTIIYDPRSEVGVPVNDYKLSIDVKAPGLVIGLVSNGFPDAENLLVAVGRALATVLDEPEIRIFARNDPSVVAHESVVSEVVSQCDAVVTAMGHCGSCTSSTVRDAVTFAGRGLPTVGLVTAKFWESGSFVARSVGMPEVPRVMLPYPVAGTGLANIARIADEAASQIVRRLGGADE
jgi:hypothetical protein